MRRRWWFPLFVVGTFLGVFAVGSFLEAWTVWSIGWEAVPHRANLWDAVSEFPRCQRQCHSDEEFWDKQRGNVLNAGKLLLVSGGAGLIVYLIGRRRRSKPIEAADYKEAAGGAVQDGRVDPNRT